jgi:hypothetical protein
MRGDPPSDRSGNNGARHYHNRYPKKSDSPIWLGLWSTAIIPKPNKTACTIIKTMTASARRIFVSLVIATPFLSHFCRETGRTAHAKVGGAIPFLRPLATPG